MSTALLPTGTFRCPDCLDTYQRHWREADTELCRSCAGRRDGRCIWVDTHPEHISEHPCSWSLLEVPGEPCRYCGDPTPADSSPCPRCWVSLAGLSLATQKALFAAADSQLSIGGLGSSS